MHFIIKSAINKVSSESHLRTCGVSRKASNATLVSILAYPSLGFLGDRGTELLATELSCWVLKTDKLKADVMSRCYDLMLSAHVMSSCYGTD